MLPTLLLTVSLPSIPALVATRTTDPPRLDGRLDDRAWAAATPSDAFVQKYPAEGAAPTEPTSVRFLYDDEALYVGIDCHQTRVPIVARLTRRDRVVETDWVSVDLATRGDGRSAFHFQVSAAGTLIDALRYDDTGISYDWDAIWEAAVAPTDHGWSAELRIPFRILRFDARARQSWGLQIRRRTTERQETDEWAFTPRDAGGEVTHYGRLDGIADLEPGGRLELRPYVSATARDGHVIAPPATVALGRPGLLGSAGLDGRWRATPDLTLEGTLNPDFAQVEADQVVLNLTNLELFLPEKRPFFLEGLDAFVTPIQVLYTRRIGRQPDEPAVRDDPAHRESVATLAPPAPIYGAAKLVGRVGGSTTVGVLSAATGPVYAEALLADGARERRPSAPLSFYEALRLKAPVGDEASVGFIGTAVLRREGGFAYPLVDGPQALCPGGELAPEGTRCFRDAYVAGLDAQWRSTSGAYVASAQVLGSRIENGPRRMELDGTVVGPGATAPAVYVRGAKEGGAWLGEVIYEGYGRRFDPNDAGYLARANTHRFWATAVYHDTTPGALTLETRSALEVFYRTNLDGLPIGSGYQLNTSGVLTRFWEYFVEVHWRPAYFDDREVGDGTALERPGLVGLELELASDARKPFSGRFEGYVQRTSDGLIAEAQASLALRVLPQLELEVLPEVSYQGGAPRYTLLDTADGRHIFGRERAESLGVTLRGTYAFSPTLTLQAYSQLFLADGHFSDFTTTAAPARRVRLADLVPTAAPGEQPDFQEGVLNVNVVLRWEFQPGSTLFVVYTRSQVPDGELALGDVARLDVAAVRNAPAVNVFLVKLSYWWG